MPSDGHSDLDSTPPGGLPRPGRTAYVPLNRGPRLREPAGPVPAGNAGPTTVGPTWLDEHDWEPPADDTSGLRYVDEPTGGLTRAPERPTVRVPAQPDRSVSAVPPQEGDRTGELPVAAGAGRTAPPGRRAAAPPAPRRKRRWWLAAVAAVAVLLGAGGALALNRNDEALDPTADPQRPGPSAAGQPSGQPAPTPSGASGMGAKPSTAPTATPKPGFEPFAAPRKTLPGASLHLKSGESFGDALRRSDRTYGPLRMVRVFYPGLPPSWSGSRADVANRTVVVSFKAHPREVAAGQHDSRLTAWFASVPRNVDVYWSYYHEPENDVESGRYTPAQFATAFRRVSGMADKARNPRLRATLILMCWTLNPNSRRDFNAYYPGADAVDVLGWDCYNSGTKNNRYTAPGEVFSRMISKSRALGKPWGLAETGSAKIRSDSSGTGRAAWLRSMSNYLNEQKPLWVAYYDYQVSGGDFRLLDAPSQAAWRAWCVAAPA